MRSLSKTKVGLAIVVASALPLLSAVPASTAAQDSDRQPLVAVQHGTATPPTMTGKTREDFTKTRALSQKSPDRYADTWFDTESNRVTLGVTSADTVPSARRSLDAAGLSEVDVEVVKHSAADLDAIVNEVYDVPGLEAVNSAYHDWANNRVVLTATEVTDDLREALYATYGDAVALEDTPRPTPELADSRDQDESAFYAGARLGTYDPVNDFVQSASCTAGFAWRTNTGGQRILSAGHCYPRNDILNGRWNGVRTDFGGSAGDYSYKVGTATGSTFSDADGTNQGNGDLALINTEVNPNGTTLSRSGGAQVWQGGVTTTSAYKVTGVVYWSSEGDWICYSGMKRGTQCGSDITDAGEGGYKVVDPSTTYTILNSKGAEVVMRQQTKAEKGWGQCVVQGDSGAPVYDWIGVDNVVARGILSGSRGGGADDYVGKYELDTCEMWFTDIGQAYEQWSGDVKLTS